MITRAIIGRQREPFRICFPRLTAAELRAERDKHVDLAQTRHDAGDRVGATQASRDALLLNGAALAVEQSERRQATALVAAMTESSP